MNYLKLKFSQLKTEILSGITISTALVPEAISFALLVGVSPVAGLWAAFFMSLSTALFGGRPGIISGATGATAVILASFVAVHGETDLYLTVFMAGIIQLIIWLTNSWKIFTYIPKIVVSGFLIALALMILQSQFKYFEIGNITLYQQIQMIIAVIISAIAMYFSNKYFKFPPAITAIIVGTILGVYFNLPTIGDLSSISNALPIPSSLNFSLNSILIVLPYSFGMAISGLTESLLTVDNVCEKLNVTDTNKPKSRETLAQSIGNLVSGCFSSIGGCVLVGQTNLNIAAGAKHRLSAITASIGLLLIMLILGTYIEMLPLAGLIGVMMIVVYQTGDWLQFRTKNHVNLISLIVTIISSLYSHNLAIGVILGTISYYVMRKIGYNDKII
jgi:SulP family sulfate permease